MSNSSSSSSSANIVSPYQSDCLSGKVALVTGGGSGIGFEIANQFLQHGAKAIVICGRRKKFLERSSKLLIQQQQHKDCSCLYKVCDVRDPRQCQEAVDYTIQQLGRLDILVNGAAGNFLAQAQNLSSKGFATVMAIDSLGTFNMSRAAHSALTASALVPPSAAAPSRQSTTTSLIINISATLQYGATWWQSHASAAKAAVDSLTRSLALEWGFDKIRVVGIAPGATADSPGMTKLAPNLDASDINDMVSDGIPLQRLGFKEEIGLAAVYMATADYVTGHVLVVDGGEWLYRPPLVPKEMVGELSRKVEPKSRAQAPKSML